MNITAPKHGSFSRKFVDFFHFFYLGLHNHFFNKIPSYLIRKVICKYFYGMKIGRHSNLQMGIRVYAPWKISIGDNCSIGHDSLLDGRRGITIGNNVDIAGYVRIFTLGHNLNDPSYKTTGRAVIIEDDVSIFTGAYVLPGRLIRKGSVVALAAVITRDTDAWGIYGGNPATKLSQRKINQLTYLHNYKRYFH